MIDWAYVLEILPPLVRALGVTVEATVAGMALALALGLVWAVLQRSAGRVAAAATRGAVDFVRSTPLLVQVYFLFYAMPEFGVAFSPLATGILALGLHYSAYTAEIYRAGIEGVPRGQWEAALALNLSRWDTLRRVILPQALPPVVPALGNRFIALFKDTPMLSAITVLELLQTAKILGSESFRYFEPLTLVGLFFLGLSLVSAWGVQRLESRLAVHG
jgi:polar amino acid transport system permease protein